MDSYWGSHMTEEEHLARTALPLTEQVSRGQELLHMLGVDSHPDHVAFEQEEPISAKETNVDLTVLVKNSFIEVVVQPGSKRRGRSMTDSVLMDYPSDLEQPWDSEKPWKQRLLDKFTDMSDASTNASLEAEDCNIWSAAEASQNADAWCASDCSTTLVQVMYHPPHAFQCMESWWMPAMQEQAAISDIALVPSSWKNEQRFSQRRCNDVRTTSEEWRTTAMIRNMPNNYSREMLLELLDSMGFAGSYDFAYLPIDFKSEVGLGYAFVNFVSSEVALRCFALLEGYTNWRVPSEKVCTVVWGSPYQGLASHIERYQNSPVMHHSVPDEWKPMLFQHGVPVVFPRPSKQIKAPKIRKV